MEKKKEKKTTHHPHGKGEGVDESQRKRGDEARRKKAYTYTTATPEKLGKGSRRGRGGQRCLVVGGWTRGS